MSDLIKTGYMGCTVCHGSRYPDGENECKNCHGSGEEVGVSLSLLCGLIQDEISRRASIGYSTSQLNWVLNSLLQEKKKCTKS